MVDRPVEDLIRRLWATFFAEPPGEGIDESGPAQRVEAAMPRDRSP
jgi:hypothetical protein